MSGGSPRVLVCGTLKGRGLEILESGGCEVDHRPDHPSGSLADVIAPFAAVIVHSGHLVDAATIAAGKSLRVVGRAGVGVDNIDLEAATAAGVLVMNLPWGNTVTAAEHTVALMLALARNVPQAAAALRAGVWDRKPYLGVELEGKKLGIVGFGRIGREVARRAQALEMQVVAFDPYMSARVAADLGIELVELDELLPIVDVLTLHVPLSAETRHLIDAEALAKMKPGARLINCARGGLVDEGALLAALESGHIAGAAFDVFENEPEPDPSLLAHPRFIGTPHLGGATLEAQEKVGEGIARQVVEFLRDGAIHHAINVQALPPEEQRPMLPYMDLARRLGSMLSQCFTGIETLRIEYFGELTRYTTRPVSAAALVGFFEPHLAEQVNPVNVWNVARDRGIEVEEASSSAASGYASLLRVVGKGQGGEHALAGTVFDAERPRVVELDGLPIELTPEGHLLLFANDDRPGVVGAVGAFLGDRGVNIAEVRLARAPGAETAIAVMTLDSALDAETLEAFEELEVIKWARFVTL
ncbi:MAG TPA: phosphoglycerate dehydrogenase [Acidobacteriota bacterium]